MAKKLSLWLIQINCLRRSSRFLTQRLRHGFIFFLIGLLLIPGLISLKAYAHNFQISQTFNSGLELVKKGQQNYQLGQFRQAVQNLRAAIDIYQQQGDRVNQAITLSNLSLAYQQLGEWNEAQNAITKSFQLLNFEPETGVDNLSRQQGSILARALNIYGRLWYQQGQGEMALDSWRKASQIYQQLNQQEGLISSQINQIQALQALGLYQQAQEMVSNIEQVLNKVSLPLQAKGWRTLGELWQTIGELKGSEEMLNQSLFIAQKINSAQEISATSLSLGNHFREQVNLIQQREDISKLDKTNPWQCVTNNVSEKVLFLSQQALAAYDQVSLTSPKSALAVKAQINQLDLLLKTNQIPQAQRVLQDIDISYIPPGQTAIYAQIKLAKNLACLQQKSADSPNITSWKNIENSLRAIIQQARILEDKRALSYALGNLGGFYEYLSLQDNRLDLWPKAQQLTEEALLLAQPSQDPNIAYLWQWQLGRIFARQQETEKALMAYENTVKSLDKIRGDLLTINADVQFSFRDNVEPVYRQFINLILNPSPGQTVNNNKLAEVIDLIDALQLAELENFLRCDLTSITRNQSGIESIKEAALIYPVLLENKFYVLYKLPNQSIKYKVTNIAKKKVENTLIKLRQALGSQENQPIIETSTEVYQWLIKPLENDLEQQSEITTLVFVLDGYLRNIPMAVLYDEKNQEFLVQKKYALALLPTSKLLNLRPSSQQLNVLAAGISEALQVEQREFSEIKAQEELEILKNLVPTNALLNAQFTQNNLRKILEQEDFSVIHLATHGSFSSDPQETYILAYRELLTANELNNLLETENRQGLNELELLVLSACETASGDNRATLGLAGLAVRAGAKSTLASLWLANDDFTIQLIERFYKELTKGVSKAEALHQAQKALVYQEFDGLELLNSPYNWGAYVLVGNWQ
ncbi:MAG: CHAT domain-containing protein [Crocinitomicaceae bacterium]|nr:CHAT domain-containing protein [Crocinitomicaceae bacterium]